MSKSLDSQSLTRWLAGCIIAVGLGSGLFGGAGIATADLGTESGVANDVGSTPAPSGDVERRTYKPVTIKKEVAVSTPLLLNAIP